MRRGGKWRILSLYSASMGWRIVAENGGFCRSVASMDWRIVAENGGFCRSVASMDWRIVAENGGFCHSIADYVERISSIFTTPLELKRTGL